jgi:uncharacterized membrane protein
MSDYPERRSDPQPPAPGGGFDLNHPTIVSLLYIASCVTGVTAIVGLVLSYVWRGDTAGGWEQSHYTYLIRTFWIGLVAGFVGVILSAVLIGIPLLIAVAVWFVVRSVLSLVRAQRRESMPDPETLWV